MGYGSLKPLLRACLALEQHTIFENVMLLKSREGGWCRKDVQHTECVITQSLYSMVYCDIWKDSGIVTGLAITSQLNATEPFV